MTATTTATTTTTEPGQATIAEEEYRAWNAAVADFDRQLQALAAALPTDLRAYRRQLQALRKAQFRCANASAAVTTARERCGATSLTPSIPTYRLAALLDDLMLRSMRKTQADSDRRRRARLPFVRSYVRAAVRLLEED